MMGQLTKGGVEAKNTTLFGKLADPKDGRLMSQGNHLVGVWMPGEMQRAQVCCPKLVLEKVVSECHIDW